MISCIVGLPFTYKFLLQWLLPPIQCYKDGSFECSKVFAAPPCSPFTHEIDFCSLPQGWGIFLAQKCCTRKFSHGNFTLYNINITSCYALFDWLSCFLPPSHILSFSLYLFLISPSFTTFSNSSTPSSVYFFLRCHVPLLLSLFLPLSQSLLSAQTTWPRAFTCGARNGSDAGRKH